MLYNKFNNRKPDIWLKTNNIIIEVDEWNHENYDSDDEKKKEKTCLKIIILDFFDVIPWVWSF